MIKQHVALFNTFIQQTGAYIQGKGGGGGGAYMYNRMYFFVSR